jgi:V8-like Glu-specific endopeptidase
MHRSIGALTSLNKNKNPTRGTAVLISPNLILTVAHNIYDKVKYKSEN